MVLLEQYRQERERSIDVGQLPTAGGHAEQGLWGRVSAVVESDPDHGAHLMVKPQRFDGTPPAAQDAAVAAMRCYPAPNHSVTDYAVDEYVKVVAARGAFVADKSA
jgi:hypothetical protein